MKPEDVQLDVEAQKQQEIDISNLRFYSRMAAEFKWGTDIIHFGVIEQTLKEIADRLALLRRVSGKGAQRQWPHKAGGIIDAWDGLSNDCASDPDLETLGKLINEMRKEIGDAGPSPAPVPATASIEALKERAEKAFTHNFKALDYSNVGRKELAIDFAVNFALKEWATTQGTPEGADNA